MNHSLGFLRQPEIARLCLARANRAGARALRAATWTSDATDVGGTRERCECGELQASHGPFGYGISGVLEGNTLQNDVRLGTFEL